MTSADDAAKAVMRAYADNLQPPPVADVIARAEHTRGIRPRNTRARSRGLLVLAAASVAAVIAVVAIVADRTADQGETAAPPPTPSTEMVRMAPGCPPRPPMLDVPLDMEGAAVKPFAAKAGQQLTLPTRVDKAEPDRPVLTFTIHLTLPGTQMTQRDRAISQSAVLQLTPDQRRVFPVLPIPTGVAPGTYELIGESTWPSPSVCGMTNPPDSTRVGRSWGVLGTVVIS